MAARNRKVEVSGRMWRNLQRADGSVAWGDERYTSCVPATLGIAEYLSSAPRDSHQPLQRTLGYASAEQVDRSALLRSHPLIEKPFSSDLLVRRVRETLDEALQRVTA
jgi:hypothetical protein